MLAEGRSGARKLGESNSTSRPSRDDTTDQVWKEKIELERLLLVSSEMGLRVSICDALEEVGYRVRVAADAEDAWAFLRAEIPEAAIIDLTGPDQRMLGIASEMNAIVAPHRVPVLGLVAEPAEGATLAPFGIDHTLPIPLSLDEVRRAVQYILEPFRMAPANGLSRWAQLAMNTDETLSPSHLTLATTIRLSSVFDASSPNEPYIADLRAKLAKLAIPVDGSMVGNELVLSFYPTIEESLSLGFNRFSHDEIFNAVTESYPDLASQPEALAKRVRELEDEYLRRQRRAS